MFKVQSWFQKNQQQGREASLDKAMKLDAVSETSPQNKATGDAKMQEGVFYSPFLLRVTSASLLLLTIWLIENSYPG